MDEREITQRDAGPVEPEFVGRAPEAFEPFGERMGAGEDQRDGGEKPVELFEVVGAILPRHDIGPVEGDDARAVPKLDKREEMRAGVPEVDVHQGGRAPVEDA